MKWFFLFLLLVPVVFADGIFSTSSAVVEVNLSGVVVPASSSPRQSLDYLVVDVSFFPKNDVGQSVDFLSTSVPSQVLSDKIRFRWDAPKEKEIGYGLFSRVSVRSSAGVYSGVPFPFDSKKVPSAFRSFVEPSDLINSGDASVRDVAASLAKDERDLWFLVSKIAIWVREHVEYNLSTLNLPATKSASWVLQQRSGVCAELTTLFVALLRSLGVPARYVSGVAYTDSPLFPSGWGGHAWAEVFFPDYGWIPFDVTFGEFGWINSGHIKMLVSRDAGEPSTRFEWRGQGVTLNLNQLDISAKIVDLGEKDPAFLRLNLSVSKDDVGPGSYSLLVVDVENLRNVFQTVELKLADVAELLPSSRNKYVVLAPKESKRVYWVVQVSPSLKHGFKYDIPLMVYTVHNESVSSVLRASEVGAVYSLADVTREQALRLEQSSQGSSLSCSSDKPFMYPYESINVSCSAVSGSVCLQECVPAVNGNAVLPLLFTSPGVQELRVVLRGSSSAVAAVTVEMLDVPVLDFDFALPESMDYSVDNDVSVSLVRRSFSFSDNVRVVLSWNGGEQVVELEKLVADQPLLFSVPGSSLSRKTTDFVLKASWSDRNGRVYDKEASFSVPTENVGFFSGVYLFFRDFFYDVVSVFD